MLKIIKYIGTILLMVSSITLSANPVQLTDPDDITIHISVQPVFITLSPYWVDIYKTKNIIKIVYSLQVLDDYRPLRINKDSLLLDRKKVESYDSLLSRFNRTSVTELENQEANKNRHLLDGVDFIFTIVSKSGSRKAYADSPDASSHPLIYELSTKTFTIYRDTKNNTSWDKLKTYGY